MHVNEACKEAKTRRASCSPLLSCSSLEEEGSCCWQTFACAAGGPGAVTLLADITTATAENTQIRMHSLARAARATLRVICAHAEEIRVTGSYQA